MKKCLLLLLILFVSKNTFSQFFEGQVTYKNKFTSKTSRISSTQLDSIMGTKQEYLIKGGFYKSFLNGYSISYSQYDYRLNRVYLKRFKVDTLNWFNADINTDTLRDYQIKAKAGKVLGLDCDVIIMRTKTGTTTIFFSKKYKIDVSKYKRHNYENWQFYLEKCGALPLKTIIETPTFMMESTAIKVETIKLEDSYFSINPSIPVKGKP